ncbi:MAG: hypothetical protein ACPGQV_10565 [Alphaproteobacteria bacterium]
MALLYRETKGASSGFIAAIAIFFVLNGALIHIIMGLRVLYGMGAQDWLHEIFTNVGSWTQTAVFATVVIVLAVAVFATWLPLVKLAQMTTFLAFVVFASANAALIRLKGRIGDTGFGFRVPLWVPVVGLCVCSAFALYQIAGFSAEIALINGLGHPAIAKLGPYSHICVVLDLDRLYFSVGRHLEMGNCVCYIEKDALFCAIGDH